MIIDNIGMLSSAYRYASVAAVGGGFGKGIHNVLEPACWGIPVLFGPKHEKFMEAVEMRRQGGGFSFESYVEFETVTDRLIGNNEEYERAAASAANFVKANSGATAVILREIFHEDINNAV
jgi:3-deoxy-D-manno-octulosonic-acid transferase